MTDREEEQNITLTVRNDKHDEVLFKIKKKTHLKKLMKRYCDKMGI